MAHAFGVIYNLPVPLGHYLIGACAALVASWIIFSILLRSAHSRPGGAVAPVPSEGQAPPTGWLLPSGLVACGRVVAAALLLLTIATGAVGTTLVQGNFSMTFFWVAFMLGLTYASALCGGLYATFNPFRLVGRAAGFGVRPADARLTLEWLGPALYLLFIAFELSGYSTPRTLAAFLIGYVLLTAIGSRLVGWDRWSRNGDFLSIYFDLISKLSVVALKIDGARVRLSKQNPVDALSQRAGSTATVVFVLLILSTTAFDAFRATEPWAELYWGPVARLVMASSGSDWNAAFNLLINLFQFYNLIGLALVATLYYLVFRVFMWATKWAGQSALDSRELGLRFVYSLLPIAFVYNLAHYFTLLLDQGIVLANLVSDPFGLEWDLFGTRDYEPPVPLLSASVVWHCQVAFILIGHIYSAFIGHKVAFQIFGSSRRAILSQVPLLLLMVGLTALGLIILGLPIAEGRIVDVVKP